MFEHSEVECIENFMILKSKKYQSKVSFLHNRRIICIDRWINFRFFDDLNMKWS